MLEAEPLAAVPEAGPAQAAAELKRREEKTERLEPRGRQSNPRAGSLWLGRRPHQVAG